MNTLKRIDPTQQSPAVLPQEITTVQKINRILDAAKLANVKVHCIILGTEEWDDLQGGTYGTSDALKHRIEVFHCPFIKSIWPIIHAHDYRGIASFMIG